ncbi:MAG TPA: T9SS type A sorting domain-containing protein [Bacteroidia bacterium]|nr:T9SS type A sorting domain-containing protein [Bacteroidia bacterium]
MKKIITLFTCLLMTKVFAGPSLSIGWNNYTQNTFAVGGAISYIVVIANAGDSVRLWTNMNCGTISVPPDYWNFNGILIPNMADSFAITVIISQSGIYSANTLFCLSPQMINIDLDFAVTINTTGIPSFKNINFLNVFPTAVTSSITIQLNSIKTNDLEISFYDMHGRQLKNDLYKNIIGEFIKNENTEALAKGIYFLRIKAGDDVVEKKFVKM